MPLFILLSSSFILIQQIYDSFFFFVCMQRVSRKKTGSRFFWSSLIFIVIAHADGDSNGSYTCFNGPRPFPDFTRHSSQSATSQPRERKWKLIKKLRAGNAPRQHNTMGDAARDKAGSGSVSLWLLWECQQQNKKKQQVHWEAIIVYRVSLMAVLKATRQRRLRMQNVSRCGEQRRFLVRKVSAFLGFRTRWRNLSIAGPKLQCCSLWN